MRIACVQKWDDPSTKPNPMAHGRTTLRATPALELSMRWASVVTALHPSFSLYLSFSPHSPVGIDPMSTPQKTSCPHISTSPCFPGNPAQHNSGCCWRTGFPYYPLGTLPPPIIYDSQYEDSMDIGQAMDNLCLQTCCFLQ